MTAAEFRAWRRDRALSRARLLDLLRGWGWTDLTMEAVNHWAKRGPSRCAVVVFGFMDRNRKDWDQNTQRTPGASPPLGETEPTHPPAGV